ncbi:hypothetical protein RWV98_16015 [Agathobaculum sp. NTUH-O15-33]|uniref:hypothetical protein n=1 Tax=Agathobaculum sp. NTUH-O15-33 TaxID=3079302 RepID=UPI002958D236|nr:hypothetical protein [Agathobaculum sp. NTUH-O15-33]WNX84065.1 hypothetical protein RWV98_16015 [Agathobaculum sp. NTUH-O15-33]
MKLQSILGSVLAVALLAGSAVTAFAAEDATAYGYLYGQEQNSARHAQFEHAAGLTSNAEREAYLEAQGIGGGQYGGSRHLDAETLAEAGVIDQVTAGKIEAYASDWHDLIHDRYSGDMSDMTPEERHARYASYAKDGADGDSVEDLLNAGVITQAQADAIDAFLGE